MTDTEKNDIFRFLMDIFSDKENSTIFSENPKNLVIGHIAYGIDAVVTIVTAENITNDMRELLKEEKLLPNQIFYMILINEDLALLTVKPAMFDQNNNVLRDTQVHIIHSSKNFYNHIKNYFDAKNFVEAK